MNGKERNVCVGGAQEKLCLMGGEDIQGELWNRKQAEQWTKRRNEENCENVARERKPKNNRKNAIKRNAQSGIK